MFKLDNNFLIELGLGDLPPVEKNKMLAHIYETLEMRVGMKLAEQMSNEQLDEFESYINQNDESGALKWLETNFPNYKQVVAEELERLKAEIKQVAPQIVAQSQQAAASGPASTTPPPAAAQPSGRPQQPPAQKPPPAPQQQQVPPTAPQQPQQPVQPPPVQQDNNPASPQPQLYQQSTQPPVDPNQTPQQ